MMIEHHLQAPRRNFLRRTKATAPPDTTETESSTDKIETTTNRFTRRGNSKFKSRKEAELAKKSAAANNEVENASRRPSLNGGARRSERPTRKFVRVRPGGANATTSTAAPLSISTSSSTVINRRPFRVTSRRRLVSTTTTTSIVAPTTTAAPTTAVPQAVTNAYEDEEYLQDIGDIDAIEDPTLEPRVPKKNFKVQRRPLVNLKEDVKDQNPSATNEEENKRQSKKYSATIKQNQLDDLLKLKNQEETTTEMKTTVDDFSAETAVAIAAHQLITAPIPSTPDFEENFKPTRNTQTTVEYKYTSREYNQYSDINRTPSYDDYQSTPIYKSTLGSDDQTTDYRNPTDFETTKAVTDFEAPKLPTTTTAIYKTDYAQTTSNEPFTSEFDASKISTYDVPKSTAYPNTVNTANTANLEFIRTNANDYTITSAYEPPKVTPTFSPRSTNFPNTATNLEFVRTTFGDTYDTQSDFDSKISTYLPRVTATNFPTNTGPQEFARTTYLDTSTEAPTYVPKFPSTDYQNTINEEFVRTTLNSYDTELNTPKISSTLAPPTRTRYFERTTLTDSPTEISSKIPTSFEPRSTASTTFSRSGSRFSPSSTNAAPTEYTGIQNTINQEFVRTSLNSYDNTQRELNAPKIFSTLAPPTRTRYFERTTLADTPTEISSKIPISFEPRSTATTTFSRSSSRFSPDSTSAAPTEYTGIQKTINQEFVRTSLNSYDNAHAELNAPKISSTLAPPTAKYFERTTFADTPTEISSRIPTSFEPRSTASTTFSRSSSRFSPDSTSAAPTEYTEIQNTINQEFGRTSLNSYDNAQAEFNAPKISSTLAPPTRTRYFERPTSADTPTEISSRIPTPFEPKSTATTTFSRSGSRFSSASTNAPTGYTGVQRAATSRFRTEKLIPVPVENTGYSTVGYAGSSQEPSYFTREYLLESPVTKTYDDEYQYLSPTTPQTPSPPPLTRRIIRKKIQRKISTTLRPTESPSSTTLRPTEPPSSTTPVPRRAPSKQVFEKIPKVKKTYRPIANYDYYDDGDDKVATNYMEGTKIVMHANGQIQCLDIGNFPHPKSCKKFISCARIDNGSLLGWEYVCPKGLSFDPVGGICNWSAGLGCDEKDV